MRNLFILISFVLSICTSYAQNVGINNSGATPDNSAILDLNTTDKGFLPPRMTEVQKIAISSPATGLTIYQTDATAGYYFYDGSKWIRLDSDTYTNTSITYSSANISTTAAYQMIPGVTKSITLSGDAKILIMIDGGLAVNSNNLDEYTISDVAINIDGSPLANAGFKRVYALNSEQGAGNVRFVQEKFSLNALESKSAGTYTIDLRTRTAVISAPSVNAVVGGASGAVNRISMIIQVIYE